MTDLTRGGEHRPTANSTSATPRLGRRACRLDDEVGSLARASGIGPEGNLHASLAQRGDGLVEVGHDGSSLDRAVDENVALHRRGSPAEHPVIMLDQFDNRPAAFENDRGQAGVPVAGVDPWASIRPLELALLPCGSPLLLCGPSADHLRTGLRLLLHGSLRGLDVTNSWSRSNATWYRVPECDDAAGR